MDIETRETIERCVYEIYIDSTLQGLNATLLDRNLDKWNLWQADVDYIESELGAEMTHDEYDYAKEVLYRLVVKP